MEQPEQDWKLKLCAFKVRKLDEICVGNGMRCRVDCFDIKGIIQIHI